jgi:protein phosphatase
VRKNNEDHFVLCRCGRFMETLLTSLPVGRIPPTIQEMGYLVLVADGLGGGAAGELASELAVLAMLNLLLETPDWILSSEAVKVDQVLQRMTTRFRRVSEALNELGREHEHLLGMATTMTMACSFSSRLALVHVGDSRAYLLRNRRLWQLTRDHTAAQQLVDSGWLSHVKEATPRLQSVLTNVLGAAAPRVVPEVQQLGLADGDQLLLCSDGMTSMVADEAIAEILVNAASAHEACQDLVEAALNNGGKDNVTVALLRFLAVGST